jgi:hypothetical protein
MLALSSQDGEDVASGAKKKPAVAVVAAGLRGTAAMIELTFSGAENREKY